MDYRYLLTACICFVYCRVLYAAKTCETQEVWGSRYNDDIEGLYDVTDTRCHGRPVYKQRVYADEEPHYIYYFWDTFLRLGWIVGTNPCANDRKYASAYVWNLNRRPDRRLLAWREYDNDELRWRINGGFNVRCTEGLTYPEIVGIAAGCCAGSFLIIIVFIVLCKKPNRAKQGSVRSRGYSDDPPEYSPPARAATAHIVQINNSVYETPSAPALPVSYTQYDHFTHRDPYNSSNQPPPVYHDQYPSGHVIPPTNQKY